MGCQLKAECLDCGKTFTLNLGGGFRFHLVRCDKCGRTKSMDFDDLGDLHKHPRNEENALEDRPVEPTWDDEYERRIEAIAGKCKCGGQYTLDAPPRCPKCRSTRLEEGEPTAMYD